MTKSSVTEIHLSAYHVSPARLTTARSYMIDRFVPACEIIALPEKQVAGGNLSYHQTHLTLPATVPSGRGARMRARFTPSATRQIEDRLLIDLRHHDPGNWAHFLNNHLPIVFRLCETIRADWSRVLLVTPQATPDYVRAAARLFGFDLLSTDDAITGEGLSFTVTPWTAVRTERANWARLPAVTEALARATHVTEPALPRRPFLARRNTRAISNMSEVEAYLTARGYETIYPEDLSAVDQFRLFREADAMVAVHGAGLAPLLYVPPNGRLQQLVEILPVGHMTDVYRVMAQQVGVFWTGVRGRIKSGYVDAAYRLDAPFNTFSLDSFEVDVVALEHALDFASDR